jgi:hypothetical protein
MPEYGYMHLGRIVSVESQGYSCEIITRAPGLRWGPVQSMVAGLTVGERVVLAQLGESVDSLVIVGRLPGRAGEISDIVGLQAALDAKLDDSQLDQAGGVAALDASRKVAYNRLPVGTTAGSITAADDARLSDARTPLPHHATHATGGTDPISLGSIGAAAASDVATNTANIATNTTTINQLLGREPFDNKKLFNIYGDAVTTMDRYAASTASASLSSGNGYAFTLYSSLPITMLNAHLGVLSGAGATVVASIYAGSTAGSAMSLVSTGPSITAAVGNMPFQAAPTASVFVVPAGFVVVLLQVTSGSFTVRGTPALDNSMLFGQGSMRVAASKALTGSPPSTLNTADGTWSYFTSMPWVSLD